MLTSKKEKRLLLIHFYNTNDNNSSRSATEKAISLQKDWEDYTLSLAQRRSIYIDCSISFSFLIPEIGNNLSSKNFDIFKVAFPPEPDDKVVCASFDKAL